jgi:hypothetical protein
MLRWEQKSKGRCREARYLQGQEPVCFKGQEMYCKELFGWSSRSSQTLSQRLWNR